MEFTLTGTHGMCIGSRNYKQYRNESLPDINPENDVYMPHPISLALCTCIVLS